MADLGLLQGLASGLQGAFTGYQTERKYQDEKSKAEADRTLRRQQFTGDLLSKGIQVGPSGDVQKTEDQKRADAIKQASEQGGLLKSGYTAEYDPVTGTAPLKKTPGYHDIEDDLKRAQIAKLLADAKKDASEVAGGNAKPDQFKAATFGRRVEKAEKDFSSLNENGFDPSSMKSRLGSLVPIEAFKPENNKLQDQAERNFVNAVLRRESGSAISPAEFTSAEKQYFARAGDTPAVLSQKKANRQQVFEGLRAEAGNAWSRVPLVESEQLPSQKKSSGGLLTSQAAPTDKTAVKTLKNTRTGQIKIVYSDGSEELQ